MDQEYSSHVNHIYADHIQIMISFNSDQSTAQRAVHRLESCMADVHDWMLARSLKLHSDKCEFQGTVS